MFGWIVKKKEPATPADKKLEEVINILFPQLKLVEEMDKDGKVVKYHVDYSADTNLDAALIDLQEGNNDAITQQTISEVIGRLNKVRKLLEAYAMIDENAKYIIVDNPEIEKDISAAEEKI